MLSMGLFIQNKQIIGRIELKKKDFLKKVNNFGN